MRVCIITNHFYPEDFKVNDIAFELAKSGFEVTVITAVPDYPKGQFYDGYSIFKRSRENVNDCKVIRLPIIPRGKGGAKRLILNYASYYLSIVQFMFFYKFFHKFDVVFVHETSPFFIGLPAVSLKKFQHIPLVFWTLDLWPESITAAAGISNSAILKPLARMVQKIYNSCDRILIGSKGFERSICEKGDYHSKIVYFPNWAETSSLPLNTEKYVAIEPFKNFSNKDFIILFAGNIGEAQNLNCILDAAAEVKENQNIKFVFIGDGRARIHLEQQAASQNTLNETVFFTGRLPLDSMPYFMSRASVLTVSLKDEYIFNLTVPQKVQFYMAQGKPLLAMLNGDGADLIKNADCGIVVNANDKNAYVSAVMFLFSLSSARLRELGNNGKSYYERYFQKSQRLEQLKEIFKRQRVL